MANEQNLRPSEYKLSQEEAKRGGIASGKARRERKRGKELMLALLENRVMDEKIINAMKAAGYDPEEITNELALHIRQIEKAQKTGDTKAYKEKSVGEFVPEHHAYFSQNVNANPNDCCNLRLNK